MTRFGTSTPTSDVCEKRRSFVLPPKQFTLGLFLRSSLPSTRALFPSPDCPRVATHLASSCPHSDSSEKTPPLRLQTPPNFAFFTYNPPFFWLRLLFARIRPGVLQTSSPFFRDFPLEHRFRCFSWLPIPHSPPSFFLVTAYRRIDC